ncbi:hypothetical protein BDQ17DRAFT_1429610 [Cyathus striatus]|nr:hypothetical protein BDQ17DRAFT_1429610 [Cyathus striatus]
MVLSDEDSYDTKPRRKKQKSKAAAKSTGSMQKKGTLSGKKARGKRGVLKQLPEMPLDVLFEIFGQLHPLDLVHLTRTTKTLRSILLEESARGVWRQARVNVVDLPECPKDLSELDYTSLIFESHCQNCLSRKSQICWDFRLRLCGKCIESDTRYTTETSWISSCIVSVCPSALYGADSRHPKTYYLLKFLHENNKLYHTLDEEGRAEWKSTELKRFSEIRDHARRCDEWLQERADERTQMLEDIRIRRVNEIVKRLTDLDWGEVISARKYGIENHVLVSQKKELTERTWIKIHPSLIEYLQEQKEQIIAALHHKRVEAHVSLLEELHKSYALSKPINAIIPPVTSFFLFKPFNGTYHEHTRERRTDCE